ncbi:glycerate kinase [Demequina capsici]|uniref:Glycerate kinase n=1 Tax=Demequina capsici TaxID=3075620 RepID=A0AA96F6C0_9MICO|nr:glycerate kinase [Demequina sp. OYTSA14]WNM23993.1 glycerate kinase [Demequina sp. OYTSA14]
MVDDGVRDRHGPLRVVVALDSFKGSVTSAEACHAVAAGVREAAPDAVVTELPVADGGEGTFDALAPHGMRGEIPTVDLLGRPTVAPYVELPHAVAVESASTLGLALLGPPTPALARRAHSYGLGLHLRGAARDSDAHRALVGLGGTGTTDGGVGMLLALGARVWLADGTPLWPDGRPQVQNPLLLRPMRVELPQVECVPVGLADVATPLLGPRGSARMFAAQKGADPELVDELEVAMTIWADALARAGAAVADVPGAGAAGGIGAALLAIGGMLSPGLETILHETHGIDSLASADVVVTGEGALDAQTAEGKVPAAVAGLAHRTARAEGRDVTVIALAGRVDAGHTELERMGLAWAQPIHDRRLPLAEAMDRDVTLAALSRAAARAIRTTLDG